MRKFVRVWSPVALVFAVMALAAGNTFEGMGRDVSATGHAMSGTAERTAPR